MKIKAFTLIIAVFSFGIAFAQHNPPPRGENPEQMFAKIDQNGDEKLSKEEVEKSENSRLIKHFDKIDKNADGFLTHGELKAAHKNKRSERERPTPDEIIKSLDSNGDNKLSKEEAEKGEHKKLAKHFDRIDANEDGFITAEELKSASKTKKHLKK